MGRTSAGRGERWPAAVWRRHQAACRIFTRRPGLTGVILAIGHSSEAAPGKGPASKPLGSSLHAAARLQSLTPATSSLREARGSPHCGELACRPWEPSSLLVCAQALSLSMVDDQLSGETGGDRGSADSLSPSFLTTAPPLARAAAPPQPAPLPTSCRLCRQH